MKVGKIQFANNLHPAFDFVNNLCEPVLTAEEKEDIRKMEKLRLELLIISANSIITGIMDGKYWTMDQVRQAILDWQASVKAEGIKL